MPGRVRTGNYKWKGKVGIQTPTPNAFQRAGKWIQGKYSQAASYLGNVRDNIKTNAMHRRAERTARKQQKVNTRGANVPNVNSVSSRKRQGAGNRFKAGVSRLYNKVATPFRNFRDGWHDSDRNLDVQHGRTFGYYAGGVTNSILRTPGYLLEGYINDARSSWKTGGGWKGATKRFWSGGAGYGSFSVPSKTASPSPLELLRKESNSLNEGLGTWNQDRSRKSNIDIVNQSLDEDMSSWKPKPDPVFGNPNAPRPAVPHQEVFGNPNAPRPAPKPEPVLGNPGAPRPYNHDFLFEQKQPNWSGNNNPPIPANPSQPVVDQAAANISTNLPSPITATMSGDVSGTAQQAINAMDRAEELHNSNKNKTEQNTKPKKDGEGMADGLKEWWEGIGPGWRGAAYGVGGLAAVGIAGNIIGGRRRDY